VTDDGVADGSGEGALLEGVTVLELGQVISGTLAGVLLADMGADVIKIEPLKGDANRNAGVAPVGDESAIHLAMNRNKRSVAVNLKTPEGLELLYRLVERADVVIDNFRPGVMARLGIDHARLAEHNPRIVTSTVTGFGEYGPAKDRPAFDLVVQAMSGHLHITGDPGGPPSRVGVPLADLAGGLFVCISVLASLVGRDLHGRGGHSDVAMLDSLVSLLGYDALLHLNTAGSVGRHGTRHAHLVPWQALETSDGYVVIAAREEKFWQALCDAIDRPELKDDPRTSTNRARVEHRGLVDAVLEEAFVHRTTAEWMELLDAHDIPAAPVHDLDGVFADPQVVAREMVQTYQHPTLGDVRYTPSPTKFDGWQAPRGAAPSLGEHTADVLRDRLGLDDEAIADLAQRSVIRTTSPA
jgi:crotonobetainyl-CoA:carnitine CoA-transferase CaiB-like acyl-CoA transferase